MSEPTIAIAGHRPVEGVTNIDLDHRRAAKLALRHLFELGHREIVFMKEPHYSSDSADRWKAILEITANLGITVRPELTIQSNGDLSTPGIAYPATKSFLRANKMPYTDLFAFNDNSALGAISAFQEAGLQYVAEILIEPEFVVRKSTAKPRPHSPRCSEPFSGGKPQASEQSE